MLIKEINISRVHSLFLRIKRNQRSTVILTSSRAPMHGAPENSRSRYMWGTTLIEQGYCFMVLRRVLTLLCIPNPFGPELCSTCGSPSIFEPLPESIPAVPATPPVSAHEQRSRVGSTRGYSAACAMYYAGGGGASLKTIAAFSLEKLGVVTATYIAVMWPE